MPQTQPDHRLPKPRTDKKAKAGKKDKEGSTPDARRSDAKERKCGSKMAKGLGATLVLGLLVVHLMGWCCAIPWGFGGFWGGSEEENKSGRVPEFDQFLMDNAKFLNDRQHLQELLPKFVELSKSLSVDSECTQYYTTILMKISKMGLDTTMKVERGTLNRAIADSLTVEGSGNLAYTMKKRHILDAFVDAASVYAWPHLKTTFKHGEL